MQSRRMVRPGWGGFVIGMASLRQSPIQRTRITIPWRSRSRLVLGRDCDRSVFHCNRRGLVLANGTDSASTPGNARRNSPSRRLTKVGCGRDCVRTEAWPSLLPLRNEATEARLGA